MFRALSVVLVVASATIPAAFAQSEKPAMPIITYQDGRVTADLKGAPLSAVLAELARAGHAELRGPADDPREITVELNDVPLQEALERLLGEHNFTLRYEEGRLKTIEVKGTRQEIKKKPASGEFVNADHATDEPAQWIAVYKVFDGRGRVPVKGRLAAVAGGDTMAWDMLVNTAIGHEDRRTRREAVRTGMQMLKESRDLRESVEEPFAAMSDADIAMLTRKRAAYRAEDLVKNIAHEAVDAQMRTRAMGVLNELGKIPYQGPIVPMP